MKDGNIWKPFLGLLAVVFIVGLAVLVMLPLNHTPSLSLCTIGMLRGWRSALDYYKTDVGEYPSSSQGLNALLTNPGISNWSGPYIEGEGIELNPKDGWRTLLKYKLTDAGPDIVSAGPDRKFGTVDDLNVEIAKAWPSNQPPDRPRWSALFDGKKNRLDTQASREYH